MTLDAEPNVIPILRYQNGRAAIDWLAHAFGFEKQAEHPAPDGTIAEAELRFGSSVISLSSANDPNPWSTVRQGTYVRVDEPDAHHDRAKAAGADIVIPPRYQSHRSQTARGAKMPEASSREYFARDPEGYLWGFGAEPMGATRGAPSIFPEMRYRDAAAAVTWLAKAFGFKTTRQIPGPDGTVVHAELQLGHGLIMIGAMMAETSKWGDTNQFLNVRLDDPDTHFARAKAAGATIIQEPHNTPYGARFYAARDPEGFLWWFSTYTPASASDVAGSTT